MRQEKENVRVYSSAVALRTFYSKNEHTFWYLVFCSRFVLVNDSTLDRARAAGADFQRSVSAKNLGLIFFLPNVEARGTAVEATLAIAPSTRA